MRIFPKYDSAGNRYEASWCAMCGEEEDYRILQDNNWECCECVGIVRLSGLDQESKEGIEEMVSSLKVRMDTKRADGCKWSLSPEEKELVLDFREKKVYEALQQQVDEFKKSEGVGE